MFDFIIPFRAKSTTNKWNESCQLLEETLKSACNQTDNRFRVLIICHDLPDIEFKKENCQFIQVEFPIPVLSKELPAREIFSRQHTDKGRKILTGIKRSRQDKSKYFMVLDADDLVSSKLVSYCLSQNHPNSFMLIMATETTLKNLVFYLSVANFSMNVVVVSSLILQKHLILTLKLT